MQIDSLEAHPSRLFSFWGPRAQTDSRAASQPTDGLWRYRYLAHVTGNPDMQMDNIYEALRESHELQRTLCRRLVRIPPADPRAREIFEALRIELAAHAAAEERFLYAPILMDDMGLDPSRHALAEHHEIDECVEDLADADAGAGTWREKARKLSHEVHHHLKEEETKFFQISGKILTPAQKKTLAGRYRRDLARMRKVAADD